MCNLIKFLKTIDQIDVHTNKKVWEHTCAYVSTGLQVTVSLIKGNDFGFQKLGI